jgi:hypothetical protein
MPPDSKDEVEKPAGFRKGEADSLWLLVEGLGEEVKQQLKQDVVVQLGRGHTVRGAFTSKVHGLQVVDVSQLDDALNEAFLVEYLIQHCREVVPHLPSLDLQENKQEAKDLVELGIQKGVASQVTGIILANQPHKLLAEQEDVLAVSNDQAPPVSVNLCQHFEHEQTHPAFSHLLFPHQAHEPFPPAADNAP